MEHYDIIQEYKREEGDTIYNHREYDIKTENKKYRLRLEYTAKNIFFLVSCNDNIEYIYKTTMDLITIVNSLSLNSNKYNNFELILKLFDKIYINKKLFININSDQFCILIIKFINVLEEETYEIKLYKNHMKINDKFNEIYNQIKLLKNNTIEKERIEEMNNKINELSDELNKKGTELKGIINQKEIIINNMNKKIIEQDVKLKELEKKNNDLINKNEKDLNEIFNKYEDKIKEMNGKISYFENMINEKVNDEKNNYNNMKEEINLLTNKIKDQEKIINNNHQIINDLLNNIEEMVNTKIEEKIKNRIGNDDENNLELEEQEDINENKINDEDKNLNYEEKINYEFNKNPKNLKFKLNITTTNTVNGWNDMFEIFTSFKDNKEYLVSPNSDNFNLDIFSLLDHQKILSLPGHKNKIKTIRYFLNEKNKNEYLISGGKDKNVIIWDVTNNYSIKQIFDTKYGKSIFSCLLLFPKNIDDIFVITSSFYTSKIPENSATKVYSLNKLNPIRYFDETNKISIYYLLSWYNKTDNKYYIIQSCSKKILINNLLENELYCELITKQEGAHYSGFIYFRENKDYLCSSSSNGYINIWDLYEKKIFKVIDILKGYKLVHIIEWNKKFIIVADFNNQSFKIINTENNSIYAEIDSKHTEGLVCIKKIYHPLYGETLLSSSRDKIIKLWTLK